MSNNGSTWRKWDLQVQTILDDRYVSISQYIDDIEINQPEKYQKLLEKIGTKELILKYDSKEYFFSDPVATVRTRAQHYSKLFCSFVEIFNEDIGGIAITDHNYEHPYLLDELINSSKDTSFVIIPGVEINVQGVHFLVL